MARFTSSNTPLVANAVYSSGTLQTSGDDRVIGLIFSSGNGTLYVEQSSDGANWDLSKSVAVVGGTGQGYSEELLAPYYRIRFVNGAADQTAFRLTVKTSSAGWR